MFPHTPRLEPDLPLSGHPAQHLPLDLSLFSVTEGAEHFHIAQLICIPGVFERCSALNMIHLHLARMEVYSTYHACGPFEFDNFFSQVHPVLSLICTSPEFGVGE